MEEKTAERINVISNTENDNLVNTILNAVVQGYSDDKIISDLNELIASGEISQGIIEAVPDALEEIGESLSDSLFNISEAIALNSNVEEEIDIEGNNNNIDIDVEPEYEEEDDGFGDIEVNEYWDEYEYCEENNKISGKLSVNFKRNMQMFKKGSVIVIPASGIKNIQNAIFTYLKNEYPKIKATLDENIFKDSLNFKNINSGIADIPYVIEGAY